MLVSETMVRDVISISFNSSIIDAATLLIKSSVSGVAVVDDNGKLVGSISERDIIAIVDFLNDEVLVRDVMNHNPVSTTANQTIETTIELFRAHGLRRVFVCDDAGKLCGIIGRRDLLRHYVQNSLRANQHERTTMRRPSSHFELGPLMAQFEKHVAANS